MIDSYYTDIMTGHNIGKDEYSAIRYAETSLDSVSCSDNDQYKFINEFMNELMKQKDNFRRDYKDPDGYGIGTLHCIERRVKDKVKRLGIDISTLASDC